MTIRFSILASGSTGNAMIVSGGGVNLLVDVGLSAKKIEQLLQELEVKCSELDAILVTHEHADHIKGLGALARKHDIPVYANEKTWGALDKHVGEIADHRRMILQTGEKLDFGHLTVESYGISHDAAEPVGFSFCADDQKLSLATDLGYVSGKVKEKLADSDVLILESNHDVGMLRMGRYPWNIKRRILSDIGHLSNEAAGEALTELLCERTKRVYLAHLSRDHNVMELAKLTVTRVLEQNGIDLTRHKLRLMDTYHDRPTKWDSLASLG